MRRASRRGLLTSLLALAHMVAGGLGLTLLPRMAVGAGVAAGADIELRLRSGDPAGRTFRLAWRRRSPRADGYPALAPLIAPPA